MIVAALALALPAGALAVGTGGSGSGGNNGGTITGGGVASGPVRWYELLNTDTADFPFGGLSGVINAAKRKEEAGDLGAFAVSKKISGALQNACRGHNPGTCLLWRDDRHSSSVNDPDTWYEVHTTHPDDNKPPVTAETTVGFNIKIWRENPRRQGFDLIFERRVGIGNGDSDPHSGPLGEDVHRRWWYGSKTTHPNGERTRLTNGELQRAGGRFSNSGMMSSGMIGDPSRADASNCKRNYRNGDNGQRGVGGRKVKSYARPNSMPKGDQWCYWEGADLGSKYFRWGSRSGTGDLERRYRSGVSGLPNDEFGDQDSGQDLGAGGRGLKEALFVKWDLTLDPQGKNSFEYKLDGAPGLFYIVQIVALDNREHIQPLNGAQSYFANQQMLKAYIANPVPGHPPNSYECGTSTTGCDKPDLNISLNATTPAQTREETTQRIETSTSDQISNFQAVFPIESDLIHFTPQMKYSSSLAAPGDNPQATYPGSYVSYGTELAGQRVARQPSPYQPDNVLGMQGVNLQEVHLRKASYLAPLSDGDALTTDPLSPNEDLSYEMTWLKPTLSNPCPAENKLPSRRDANDGHRPLWPGNPNRCGPIRHGWPQRFDAWDDLLQARLTWESVWIDSIIDNQINPEDSYGYIEDQPLRCASPSGSGDVELYPRDRCRSERYNLLDEAIGQGTQHAQGYILAANSEGASSRVPVRFQLRTNRPEDVTNAYLYERGGSLIDSRARSIDPTRAPLQTNTITGDVELNYCRQGLPEGANLIIPGQRDRKVAENELGDPNCQGPALRWEWSRASCNRSPVPAAGTFPRPTLANVRASALAGEELPAGGEYSQPLKAGQTRDYRVAPDRGGFTGIPYDGDRPGPTTAPACAGGHLHTGRWVLARQAGPGWGSNNTSGRINLGRSAETGMPLVVDYEFHSTPGDLNPAAGGTWWRLRGSYNGFTNYRWLSSVQTKGGRESDDGSSAFIRVYGPRNSR